MLRAGAIDSAPSPRYGGLVGALRRALGVVAAVWLIARMATLAVTPAELWLSGADSCQCPDGVSATCPMHHRAVPGRGTCTMRGAAPVNDVVLTALLGGSGCFLAMPAVPADGSVRSDSRPRAANVVSQPVRPDPPPPRP
jgi:hypothetical protein